jgi:hypothetical protein
MGNRVLADTSLTNSPLLASETEQMLSNLVCTILHASKSGDNTLTIVVEDDTVEFSH